jgi:hypothetical protein
VSIQHLPPIYRTAEQSCDVNGARCKLDHPMDV